MAEQNNQQKKGGQQQDANQLIQVRYDKLKRPFPSTDRDSSLKFRRRNW